MGTASHLGHRHLRLVELVITAWVVAWAAAGVVAGLQIRNLIELSDSLVQSGEAVDTAGRGLQSLRRVPVVGQQTKRLGDEVRQTAEEVRTAAASSRETIRSVSVILGAALVLIPIVPVLAVYAPARLSLARQRRAVAGALTEPEAHPGLEPFLAYRAVAHLPYETLMETSQDPWGDIQRGSYRRLANAELTRLGLAKRR